jgi:hypothetical protein
MRLVYASVNMWPVVVIVSFSMWQLVDMIILDSL